MLIGNKTDLEPEVDPSTVQGFADAHEFELNFQVSCKDNVGIKDAFDRLAEELHKAQSNQGQRQDRLDLINPQDSDLGDSDRQPSEGCRC